MTNQINKAGINQTSEMTKIISGYIDSKGQVTNKEKELEELFDEVSYFNSGSEGAADIQKQIERLEKGIAALKEEAEKLQKEIEQKNLKIDDKANKMADIMSKINEATEAYQEEVAAAVKDCIRDAVVAARSGKDVKKMFNETWPKYMRNVSGFSMNGIKQMYMDYQNIQGSMDGLADEIQGIIDNEVSPLEVRLKNTNATANLLTKTKDNLASTMKDAYKNIDTDSNVPHYSGKKEAVADEILNGEYKTDILKPTAEVKEVQDKWLNAKEKNPEGTKVDKYRMFVEGEAKDDSGRVGNKELNSFGKAVEGGMINELAAAGMTGEEIMTWVSSNWNVGIYKKDDGTWEIPVGHGKSGHQETNKNYLNDATGSSKIYTNFTEQIAKIPNEKTAASLNQENVSRLKDAMSGNPDVLTKMYNNGFTFKEAMYVLTQTFPDSGIGYDLDKQSDGRNYTSVKDSAASGGLYKDIANKINTYWGVSGNSDDSSSVKLEVEQKGDPITFQQNDKTYTFIKDRDNNGKFDYKDKDNNDILGSKDGINELKAYDEDKNGKIEGDELKNLMVMVNKQDESVGTKEDVDKYKDGSNYKEKGVYTNAVDFNVSYTTAADLGITSIDLSTIEEGSKGTKNINGSDALNTFKLTTDGKQIKDGTTARETNDTDSHLNTFYKQVADNAHGAKNNEKLYSSLSHSEFEKAMTLDGNYYNADAEAADSILKNVRSELEEAKEQAEKANPEDYDLNMDFSEFEDLYGENGKYLKGAKERAINLGYIHKNDAKSADTTTLNEATNKELGGKDNTGKWVKGTYQEENQLKLKKDEKK